VSNTDRQCNPRLFGDGFVLLTLAMGKNGSRGCLHQTKSSGISLRCTGLALPGYCRLVSRQPSARHASVVGLVIDHLEVTRRAESSPARASMLWRIQMSHWKIQVKCSCAGGSIGKIQIQVALEDLSLGSKSSFTIQ
jgi:hypothetical protein